MTAIQLKQAGCQRESIGRSRLPPDFFKTSPPAYVEPHGAGAVHSAPDRSIKIRADNVFTKDIRNRYLVHHNFLQHGEAKSVVLPESYEDLIDRNALTER